MKYKILCSAVVIAFCSNVAWADEARENRHDIEIEKQKISKKINAANIAVNKAAIAAIQLTPGPQGPQGVAGANGTNGVDGATGAQGPQGLAGAAGATGAQGLAGADGTNGVDGATGPAGLAGVDGTNGTNGTNGTDGAVGFNGADGAVGQTGPQGPQGPAGSTGVTDPVALNAAICALYDAAGAARPAICPYAVGDTGPAGGTVFYITNGGLNGFEAGPQMGPATWGCQNTPIAGAHTSSGAANTAAILAGCATPGIAARVADAYVSPNGSTGWFLPSTTESSYMRLEKSALGITTQVYYTSTEWSAAYGIKYHFFDGNQTGQQKQNEAALYFRPVRAF
ncbi:hypothetical protein D8Y20_05675 [Mariprofundus sp. EBB-1]|uniref:hypothetical protein n=1 Tax=Mariprofundus sp. EBB-1 TaxID=2650971 RepID=UPI000EF21072|nr:hypothetical protein [Mariprofundus sp. EBB-1]RLL53325.1 hypothetical protein D8Y20_05675 [Mariprofundus sp. EBB-1]